MWRLHDERREHLQSWAGLPQLGGEDNGQEWNRRGGDVCSVHLLNSGVTNICLCGLPLNREGVGGGSGCVGTDGLPSLLVLLVDLGVRPLDWPEQHPTVCKVLRQLQAPTPENQKGILLKQAAGFCL